jgi:hypothetical protein
MLKYDRHTIGKFIIGSVVMMEKEVNRDCYPKPEYDHEYGPGHVEGFYLHKDGTVLIKINFVNPSFNGLLDLIDPDDLIVLK